LVLLTLLLHVATILRGHFLSRLHQEDGFATHRQAEDSTACFI
jgi:hypothetical protein